MDEKTYYKQILKELETELTHQKQFLANLKGRVTKLETEGWTSLTPFKQLVQEWETKKEYVERAIEEIKKHLN
jgi:uncharacterized coiled-coil protein SlyX